MKHNCSWTEIKNNVCVTCGQQFELVETEDGYHMFEVKK